MSSSLSLNPILTSVAQSSFGTDWNGLIAGTAYNDPAVRYALAGGYLSPSETLPMWGGVGISESVPGPASVGIQSRGGPITRAANLVQTSSGGLTGFSVFDQAHAMLISAQSNVPTSLAYMDVNFYRLGSGARIAVAIDPSLVSLEGGIIGAQVSWDFNTQRLTPYVASTTTITINSATWSSTNGGQFAVVTAGAIPWNVGDQVFISGATNTGTGVINRGFFITGYTDSTHFVLGAPGTAAIYGTIGGSPVLNESGGALAVKILRVELNNSMVPQYNPDTGFTNWKRNDSAAIILI